MINGDDVITWYAFLIDRHKRKILLQRVKFVFYSVSNGHVHSTCRNMLSRLYQLSKALDELFGVLF